MKRITPLKLTCVGAFVAALGVGCASTGYARYDADSTHQADVGVAASAETGTDRDVRMGYSTDVDHRDYRHDNMAVTDSNAEGEARVTVTALSFNPETRANWVNRFPFYDRDLRVIQTYTFAAPDPDLNITMNRRSDLPQFSATLPPGSVYVESAGGAGEVETGRVIQHSPNPR